MSLLVSIIIPTYNRAHILSETLDSVKSQTYTNWECIVVDDGSIDETEELVADYILNDNRFIYVKRPNLHLQGGNGARNYGFEISKGEFIQFLDSDDLLSKNKLNLQLDLLIANNADVSTCQWGRFSTNHDFKIKTSPFYRNYNKASNLLIDYGNFKSFLPSHVFLIKRDVFLKSGLWCETLKINQDGELFCRVLLCANRIVFSEGAHVFYRFENKNKTSSLTNKQKAKDLTISWKLISNHLNNKNKDIFRDYIYFGKNYAFKILKENYKIEILKNFYFYKLQIFAFLKSKLN
ncbi:glycosyltransferase family 2 protein [Aurantibacter aestuarii]|uniref:Glycosyltransferase 2-like domain-containing protein n=1 Tax=Aurantibacter aestuarii TaxID=1266046 RepID=A0A2T1N5H6_9FLAO|nr:glycosyltransferase family 2 protein [Aurantibacter aestuarii]PSG86517.1 hypothetical protein C7H52_12600 [Aurantibacter aestuarii]